MSGLTPTPPIISAILKVMSGLLLISLLAQFFIAGMASITNPDWWTYHKLWVEIFQWLTLPLPVVAWFSGKPRRSRVALASLPVIQIALQYVLVHRALEGRLHAGVGLHALNGALMLLVAAALAYGCCDSRQG